MIHAAALNTPNNPNLSTHLDLDNYLFDHELHTKQINTLAYTAEQYLHLSIILLYTGPPSTRQMHGKHTRVLTSQRS